jgi:DNA modification methylase
MKLETNVLYYGDNLEILGKYIPDDSIDLIYLDPPFNSQADYNILYREKSGELSHAQVQAFVDTWQWGIESEAALQEIALSPITKYETKEFMSVLPNFVGQKTPIRAYLTMMCIRLVELKRVMKDTGSIYLHCDSTASHYLKLLMDTIFGVANYKNEITWKRFNFHADAHRFGRVSDRLLFYTKTDEYIFNRIKTGYSEEYVENKFVHYDSKGRFRLDNLNPPANRGPIYQFHGVTKAWRYTEERMLALEADGRIYSESRVPQLKRYLDELEGQTVHDIWADIPAVNSQAKERLGYPTQKPEALLERIILASSNENDIVLDPFCGCGSAVVEAQKLNRRWIGIDITNLAISTMKYRFAKIFPNLKYAVIGEPKDLEGAKALAEQDKYQFQWWAISLIKFALPYEEKKKGADTGIDGYVYFQDEKDKNKKVIISVKGGHRNVSQVRDLVGVIQREKAEMGIFITLESITKPMEQEAALEGFYHSPNGQDYPKIQIFTIEELLNGKKPEMPSAVSILSTPEVHKKKEGETRKLL